MLLRSNDCILYADFDRHADVAEIVQQFCRFLNFSAVTYCYSKSHESKVKLRFLQFSNLSRPTIFGPTLFRINRGVQNVTCHLESHSVSCHVAQVKAPSLIQTDRQTCTRLTFPGGMEGWVDLGGWIHYLLADSHSWLIQVLTLTE